MPKSKDVSKYPHIYFDLFRQVESGTSYCSPVIDRTKLQSLRFDLYGFLGALEHENHPKARLWKSYTISINKDESTLSIIEGKGDIEDLLASTLQIKPTFIEEDLREESEDLMGDILNQLNFKS